MTTLQTTLRVMDARQWRAAAAAHEVRAGRYADPFAQRRARHEVHPVEDFLFTCLLYTSFLKELREGLEGIENPIDQLAVYIRLQINDLARRHLPPGPAMRSMLSPESYAKLGKHVQELQMVLANILSAAIAEKYIPQNDIRELAMLVHGSLSSSAGRTEDAPDEQTREHQILNTIRFIQMGLGARFDTEGNPVRLDSEELAPQLTLAQDDSGQKDAA